MQLLYWDLINRHNQTLLTAVLCFCHYIFPDFNTIPEFISYYCYACYIYKSQDKRTSNTIYNFLLATLFCHFLLIQCFKQLYILTGTHTGVYIACYCFYIVPMALYPRRLTKRSKYMHMKATVIETTCSCCDVLHKI